MAPAQAQNGVGSEFDTDVLAEIETRMASDAPASSGVGDKVELDKADLPLDFDDDSEPESQPEPEVEVDLAPEGEADRTDGEAQPGEAKGGKKKRLIIAGAAVLILLISVGAWFMMSSPAVEEAPPEQPPWFFEGPMPDLNATLRLDLNQFIVPLVDSGEGRILRINISLEAESPESKMEAGQEIRMLRDLVYRVMRDRPASELKTERGKRLLQAQIKTEVNHALGRPLVYRVYFTQFVITG